MYHFTKDQLNQIKSRGISLDEINNQLALFRKGIAPVKLIKPAIPGDGIEVFRDDEISSFIKIFHEGKYHFTTSKFVPSSGAASRMFKDLFEVLAEFKKNLNKPELVIEKFPQIKNFFDDIEKYPFFTDLNEVCIKSGANLNILISEKKYSVILDLLLNTSGLNYGALPKGLLKFHSYGTHFRTPLQEHMVEASSYLRNQRGQVNLHFTVSAEHRLLFENLTGQLTHIYHDLGVAEFNVSFSEQKPSTDTLAVTMDNEPFLIQENSLLFRPGGHGALLENLQDMQQTLILIGNIDNVSPDHLKPLRVKYKELLAGVLIQRVQIIHSFLIRLERGITPGLRLEITGFIEEFISTEKARKIGSLHDIDFKLKAAELLNKPIRVCGMVKNTGEPGGGPFWIEEKDGGTSKQIIESSQIDLSEPGQKQTFNSSTHFNPVDLVCFTRDFKGDKFKLQEFSDPEMAFIATKSQGGRELKSLELPGLWNGAMAEWITFFVEVPGETFSPVKTVFDLLRMEHI